MSSQPQQKGLEIEQDLRYQAWEWPLQRIGWILMGLIVLGALLGFLGEGPLTKKTAATADGSLSLQYGQVLHYHNPTQLRLQVAAGATQGNELRLSLSASYLEAIDIKTIAPKPLRMEAGTSGHTFVFALANAAA